MVGRGHAIRVSGSTICVCMFHRGTQRLSVTSLEGMHCNYLEGSLGGIPVSRISLHFKNSSDGKKNTRPVRPPFSLVLSSNRISFLLLTLVCRASQPTLGQLHPQVSGYMLFLFPLLIRGVTWPVTVWDSYLVEDSDHESGGSYFSPRSPSFAYMILGKSLDLPKPEVLIHKMGMITSTLSTIQDIAVDHDRPWLWKTFAAAEFSGHVEDCHSRAAITVSKSIQYSEWVECCVGANRVGIDFSGTSESTQLLLGLAGLRISMVCFYHSSLYIPSFLCAASLRSSRTLCI